ncbi:hypothetical protein [Paenibacillus sp. GCM10027626]|uniref:hypothetical protein n=1 Tax=Paenibacillus sp. GCM10027626 TaxID=3273411 RepID=UPI00362D3761
MTLKFQQRVDEIRDDVKQYTEGELRVPPSDSIIYTPLYIDILKEQRKDKPRIGLFGPSTVYGTTVKKGENTTAGVLQAEQPAYKVANLGLTGARFTETYAILSDVIDSIDYVVYEINYGIAVISDQESEVTVYPQLVAKLGHPGFDEWTAAFPEKQNEQARSQFQQDVEQHVLNEWPLYRDRDLLSFDHLKTRTTKERLRRIYQKWADGQGSESGMQPELTTAYVAMTKEQQAAVNDHFKELYAWKRPFDPKHSFGLYAMEQTLKLLKQHGKKVLFYTAPLDRELIDREQLLDWQEYSTVMAAYRQLIESYNYALVDFNQDGLTISHQYYHDPSHLLDEGSKQFGQILARKIRQQLLP